MWNPEYSPDAIVYTGAQMMAVCAGADVEVEVNMPVSYFHGLRGTELEATVRDDSSEGHAENSVKGKEVLGASSRLLKRNEQTVEGFVSEPTSEERRVRA